MAWSTFKIMGSAANWKGLKRLTFLHIAWYWYHLLWISVLKMNSAVCDDNDTTRAAASSINMMTHPGGRLCNRVRVHAITGKKEGLRSVWTLDIE